MVSSSGWRSPVHALLPQTSSCWTIPCPHWTRTRVARSWTSVLLAPDTIRQYVVATKAGQPYASASCCSKAQDACILLCVVTGVGDQLLRAQVHLRAAEQGHAHPRHASGAHFLACLVLTHSVQSISSLRRSNLMAWRMECDSQQMVQHTAQHCQRNTCKVP